MIWRQNKLITYNFPWKYNTLRVEVTIHECKQMGFKKMTQKYHKQNSEPL